MSGKNGGERLGSRLGFILLSAGCAIGLGNVWKFPYVTGQNGGGIFLIIYLIVLLIFGVPVMTAEFAIGRASQKAPIHMYNEIEPRGSKWHLHGPVCMVGCILLMMYYSVIAGWILNYFVKFVAGEFVQASADDINGIYNSLLASPGIMIASLATVIILGFGVCAAGLQNGLERVTKYMMAALLAIMLVLCFKSFTMSGSKEGLSFFLLPDFERTNSIGWPSVILNAVNQAFFTLSIGLGGMAIFGSYIGKERSLLGESLYITLLDTFVAVTAGLIMFPACFSYEIDVDAGPGLLFITMPNVFANMPLGRLWGALFFLFMSFAALSTAFAMFENIIANIIELTNWSRKRTCLIAGTGMFLLSLPCVLGFNIWSSFQPLGDGTTVLDLEDFIVSNILLPIGGMIFVIFCSYNIGWGWNNFIKESNAGEGLKVPSWLKNYMRFVIPLVLLVIFIMGIIDVVL